LRFIFLFLLVSSILCFYHNIMFKAVIILISGPLFLISFSGYLYITFKLRKLYDNDLDDYYYELEDKHPGLAKFNKWSKISLSTAIVSALLLFIAIYV